MRYSCAIFRCTYLVKIVCHVNGKQKSVTLLENYADLTSLYTHILSEERRLNSLGNRSSSTWQELDDRTLDKNTKKNGLCTRTKESMLFWSFRTTVSDSFFSFFPQLFCFTNVTKKYMEKKVYLQLNGSRKIVGILRGYDIFLNVVLDDAVEVRKDGNKTPMGSQTVIRGNSIASLEALETLS